MKRVLLFDSGPAWAQNPNMTLPNRPGYRLRARGQKPPSPSIPLRGSGRKSALRKMISVDHVLQSTPQSSVTRAQTAAAALAKRQDLFRQHALAPVVQQLTTILARPGALLAALVATEHEGAMDQCSLLQMAAAYVRGELEPVVRSWQANASGDHVTSEAQQMNEMMLKATLWYLELWKFVSASCIEAVLRTSAIVTQDQQQALAAMALMVQQHEKKRRVPSFPPMFDASSSDAMSQGMVTAGSMAKRPRLTRHSNDFMVGWFLAHKANPYPSATERLQIAEKTGLTEQQVRNWFANMRKRHWKPTHVSTKKPRCLLDMVLRKHEV